MKLNFRFPFFVRSSPIKDRGVTSRILVNNLTRVATSRKLAGCPRPVEIYNIATTTIYRLLLLHINIVRSMILFFPTNEELFLLYRAHEKTIKP